MCSNASESIIAALPSFEKICSRRPVTSSDGSLASSTVNYLSNNLPVLFNVFSQIITQSCLRDGVSFPAITERLSEAEHCLLRYRNIGVVIRTRVKIAFV